ncbi:MAG: hypothetical protein AAFN70_05910, partial [Planctomycetota bacterium]
THNTRDGSGGLVPETLTPLGQDAGAGNSTGSDTPPAGNTSPSASNPSLHDLKSEMLQQLETLDNKLEEGLEGTALYRDLRLAILVLITIVVIAAIVVSFFQEGTARTVSMVVAAIGSGGFIAGVLNFIHRQRETELRTMLTFSRYRLRIIACENTVCLTEVAKEVSDEAARLGK